MPIDKQRPIAVKTPFGGDVLLLHRMTASEHLGRLFDFELELYSKQGDLDFDIALGKDVTVSLPLEKGVRFFHGYVSRFAQVEWTGTYFRYEMSLKPWLWFLTLRSDCRIFPNMTGPEIVKKVLSENKLAVLDEKNLSSASYRKIPFCVQYRETDFNFVSRIMEQEGIYYFFRHEDGKHTMMLMDQPSGHGPFSGYDEIPYRPPSDADTGEEHLHQWVVSRQVQPGSYALNDFDFLKPKANLLVRRSISKKHSQSDLEIYDYPGEFLTEDEGGFYARRRIEEFHARAEAFQGAGDARGVAVGSVFELKSHPKTAWNQKYLVVSAFHELTSNRFQSGESSEGDTYSSSLVAIDAKQAYRSERTTPKPIVQGPQTAIVVGTSGEEIDTDPYGRVKVQFHWEKESNRKENETSSCWIRVAQVWAGNQWGSMHIPRIGQEVMVEFLEGDPDHPIITGRVYNFDNKPPYDLDANKTQSGIKSRSSKDGTGENYNEIRFEDKKGEEHILIHAEKNQMIEVENDESHTVGHDRTKKIKNDETTTVGNNRTETVDKDESITISGNRTESVGKDESITISGSRTESVSKDESISISGSRTESVDKDESITITNNRTESVGKDESITISGNRTEEVTKKETVSVGDVREVTISKDDKLSVGKKWLVQAGDEIAIQVGSASITMKKDGTISIKGKDITLDGSGKINIKASSDITLKGSSIKQN